MSSTEQEIKTPNVPKTIPHGQERVKVSVCMMAYNHEKYISQALESVLMQEVNFDYEIVIGEDCSIDRTTDIILGYQKKYPGKIQLLRHPRNLGIMRNLGQTIRACRGDYMATLDGDDYWTSPHKLQKQVDYLDSHPECAMCFHNIQRFYQEENRAGEYKNPPDQKEVSTLDDLWEGCFVAAGSAMLRRNVLGELPEWFFDLQTPDWPLFILAAKHGNIGYINEAMGVYRTHAVGAWSGLGRIPRLEQLVRFYTTIDTLLKFEHHRQIRVQVAKQCTYLSLEYEKNGDLPRARKYALKGFYESPFNNQVPGIRPAKMLMRVYAPKPYRFISAVRKRLGKMRG
jgi:glycosyltransferase involved in cell wall biosynthesis